MKIKITIITLTIITIMLSSIPADAGDIKLTGYGVKGGLCIAKWRGSDASIVIDHATMKKTDPESLTKFTFGGFAELSLSPAFAIQPEVYYVTRGTKYSEQGLIFRFDVNYLEIPILFKYTIHKPENIKPFLYVGPDIAFRMSTSANETQGDASFDFEPKNIRAIDAGLVFGAGMGLTLKNRELIFEIRYTLGITKVQSDVDALVDFGDNLFGAENWGDIYINDAADIKNGTLMFLAGFEF